jgi:hypothetical protein
MRNALKKVAETAKLPFLEKKSSDEYQYSKDLPGFLASFKYITVL